MSLLKNISNNLKESNEKDLIVSNTILTLNKVKELNYLNIKESKFKDSIDYIIKKLGGN